MTEDLNLADIWEAIADRLPDAAAQRCAGTTTTCAETDRRADGVATALLAAGLRKQSKVAQYLFNGPEYLESMFACFEAGLVPVNTNYRYGDNELAYLWENADIEAVVFHADLAQQCEALRPRFPDIKAWICVDAVEAPVAPEWSLPYSDLAFGSGDRVRPAWGRSGADLYLLYTGGTTGMPKGVMWPQHDLVAMLDAQGGGRIAATPSLDAYAADLSPGPMVLPGAPLMHGTAAWFAMSALLRGGAVATVSQRRFDAPALLDEVANGVKGLCIVGDAFGCPLLTALEAEPERWDLTGLRIVLSSGVMFSPEVKAGLLRHAPNATLLDALGSSESGTMAQQVTTSSTSAEPARFRVNERTRVIDETGRDIAPGSGEAGLLAVTGHVPLGYYKDPEKTAATFRVIDGVRYVVAGDWAEVAADGAIRLLGRGSGCVNTGGEKVFPEEVEEALKELPSIADAAVVGLPDERLGQRVVAVVSPASGAIDHDSVLAHVRRKLAGYKTPKAIVEVPLLQRSPSGKLDYASARRAALEAEAAQPTTPKSA